MKRLMILLLAAMLLLPVAAAEGNRMMKLNDAEYLTGILTDGETLYAVGDSVLYSCKPGDAEMTRWESDIRLPGDDGSMADVVRQFYDFTLFIGNGALSGILIQYNGDEEVDSLVLFDVAFTDHGTVEAVYARTLAVPSDLRDQGWFYIEKACGYGDALYLRGATETGSVLCVLDVNNPKAGRVERMTGWDCSLLLMPDGVMMADRDDTNERQTLYRVEEDANLDGICELPMELWTLAADPVTGDVFGSLDGKAVPVDISTGETGEPVAVLPTTPQHGALLDGGRIYATDIGANVALLDTAGTVSTDATLKICGLFASDWMQNAVVDFTVSHPEIIPTLDTDYITREDLMDAMLTQSPDVDIYIMDCKSSGALQTVRERGFMLPLDGSDALTALAGRMYPAFREGCSKDGALVALPTGCFGYSIGVDERALEKLGMSIDDLPGDWLGFLNFLEEEIKPRLGELGELDRFTYDGMTAEYFRYQLCDNVLNDFINAAAAAGEIPDYEDPDLLAILEKLDSMDFTEYGLPEDDEEYGYGWTSDSAYLIQPEVGIDLGESLHSTCLALDIGRSLKGVFGLEVQVAFVNPFSAHKEEAVAFIELLADRLPDRIAYMMFPDLSEPVRWDGAEAEMERQQASIDQAKAELEAADPQNRQALEDALADMEKEYQNYVDSESWMITEDGLAWYRENADRVAIAVPSWFDQDTSGEAWDLLNQYRNGLMSAREFLSSVNRKARMMAMEG